MRARVAGTASPRTLPVQKLGMIMPVYERTPRVTERMQSLPGGGGSSSQMVARPGGKPKRPQKSYDNIPGAFTGGGARSTRVKDGKAELVATMSSTQPVFRELKSFELARPAGSILARDRYDTYDAKDRSEEGEGQGKKDFTMELMMTMDSDNLGWSRRPSSATNSTSTSSCTRCAAHRQDAACGGATDRGAPEGALRSGGCER